MNFQCKGCEFAKKVGTNGGWSFMGCTFEPYKGKWIAETKRPSSKDDGKECPKNQLDADIFMECTGIDVKKNE